MLNTQYPAVLVPGVEADIDLDVDVACIPDDISRVPSTRVKTKFRIK